jgi:hypothetical protein
MSRFSISVKDYAIGAGETLRIHVPGTFFQLMEASAAVDVSIMRAHSIFGDAEAVPLGFSVGPLNDAEAFDGVEIYSATAQTVKVCIARGAVDLRSITQVTGTVQVVNGELSRVMANEAFGASVGIGAVAGQYSVAQLYNPADSGVNVVLSKLSAAVSATALLSVVGSSAAIGTSNGTGVSKKIGGAGTVVEGRKLNTASALLLPSLLIDKISVVNHSKEIGFLEPIVIPPGNAVEMWLDTVNVSLIAAFQWYEVPV